MVETTRSNENTAEILRNLDNPAVAWSLAEQYPPNELKELVKTDKELLQIVVSMLDISEDDITNVDPANLETVLSIGIGNIYWDPFNVDSWLYGLGERFERGAELLNSIDPTKLTSATSGALKLIERIPKILNHWKLRIQASHRPEDDALLQKRLDYFTTHATSWRNGLLKFNIDVNPNIAELTSAVNFDQGNIISPQSRREKLQRIAEETYGISLEDAKIALDQVFNEVTDIGLSQLSNLPHPPRESSLESSFDFYVEDLVAKLEKATAIFFQGVKLQENGINIEGRTSISSEAERAEKGISAAYDPLLERFKLYFHPGFNLLAYNIGDGEKKPVTAELFRSFVHEMWAHAIADIFNRKLESAGNLQLLLHRSSPDPFEETLAWGVEKTMGDLFAKLLDVNPVANSRDYFNIYRCWADYAYNYEGKTLDKVKIMLRPVINHDLDFNIIIDTIQEKPGMYLFSYLALPHITLRTLKSKGYSDIAIFQLIRDIVMSGQSWVLPLHRQAEKVGEWDPYSRAREGRFKFEEERESLDDLSLEDMVALAKLRPGQVLKEKPIETWELILSLLNNHEPEIPPEDKKTNKRNALSNLLAKLEKFDVVKNNLLPLLYKPESEVNVDAENLPPQPAIFIQELFELFLYAVRADIKQSKVVQQQLLLFIRNSLKSLYDENHTLQHFSIYPVYVLQRAVKIIGWMNGDEDPDPVDETITYSQTSIQSYPWTTENWDAAGDLINDLAILQKKFTTLIHTSASGKRTNKEKYENYVQTRYRKTVTELRTQIQGILSSLGERDRTVGTEPNSRYNAYIDLFDFFQKLGLDSFPDTQFSKPGGWKILQIASFLDPFNKMLLTEKLPPVERSVIVKAMTNLEIGSMAFNEKEALFFTNVLAQISKIFLDQKLLNNEEVAISRTEVKKFEDTIENTEYGAAYAMIMDELINEVAADATFMKSENVELILEFCRDYVEKLLRRHRASKAGDTLPKTEDLGKSTKAALMPAKKKERSILERYERFRNMYRRHVIPAVKRLPPDHVLVKLVQKFNLSTGVSDGDFDQLEIFEYTLKKISDMVWNHQLEKTISYPFRYLDYPITIHEGMHAAVRAFAINFDPEGKLASKMDFGPQFESLATFMSIHLTSQRDPALAMEYIRYNLELALVEISLNYGLDENDPKPSSTARAWEVLTDFLTPGEAAYIAILLTESERAKPWRLSYIADYEIWQAIYDFVMTVTNDSTTTYAFLLFTGNYNPHEILAEIQSDKQQEFVKAVKVFEQKYQRSKQ